MLDYKNIKQKLLPQSPVNTVDDLPADDKVNTFRYVVDYQATYAGHVKTRKGWVPVIIGNPKNVIRDTVESLFLHLSSKETIKKIAELVGMRAKK